MTIDTEHLWDEIIEEQDGWLAMHVHSTFADEVDLDLLFTRPELDATRELWIEHWMTGAEPRDDYRPWFGALARRRLPALRSLTFGGYSDRSIDAHLGSAAGLAATLETLERLVLVGDGAQLEPLHAPRLRELWLELGGFPVAVARRVLTDSVLPSLVALRIRLRDMSGADPEMAGFRRVAPLFDRTDIALEQLALSGLTLTRDDLEALLAAPTTARLRLLDLGGTTLDGDAGALLAARERLAEVLVVPPRGVTPAALVAGGLQSCSRQEVNARVAAAVPSRW